MSLARTLLVVGGSLLRLCLLLGHPSVFGNRSIRRLYLLFSFGFFYDSTSLSTFSPPSYHHHHHHHLHLLLLLPFVLPLLHCRALHLFLFLLRVSRIASTRVWLSCVDGARDKPRPYRSPGRLRSIRRWIVSRFPLPSVSDRSVASDTIEENEEPSGPSCWCRVEGFPGILAIGSNW